MKFDPLRWPNAITLAGLLAGNHRLGVHCLKCARFASLNPAELALPYKTVVPSLAGKFRCSRCGSTETEARPEYRVSGPRLSGFSTPAAADFTTIHLPQASRPNPP